MPCPKCVAHPTLGIGFVYADERVGADTKRHIFFGERREATVLLLGRAAHLLAASDAHSVMCERGWHSAVVHRRGKYVIPESREMTWQDFVRAVTEQGTASSPLVTSAAVLDWCRRQTPSRISPSRQGEGMNYEAWWDSDEDAARSGSYLLKFKVGRNQTDDNLWALRELGAAARQQARERRLVEVPWNAHGNGRRPGSRGKWMWDDSREPDPSMGTEPLLFR